MRYLKVIAYVIAIGLVLREVFFYRNQGNDETDKDNRESNSENDIKDVVTEEKQNSDYTFLEVNNIIDEFQDEDAT